jgi:hypothetical protein
MESTRERTERKSERMAEKIEEAVGKSRGCGLRTWGCSESAGKTGKVL